MRMRNNCCILLLHPSCLWIPSTKHTSTFDMPQVRPHLLLRATTALPVVHVPSLAGVHVLRLAWLDKLELFALSGSSSLPDLPPTEEEVLLQTVASASGSLLCSLTRAQQ